MGNDNFDNHLCGSQPKLELDWIVPQMGLLHYEMNAGKSFMSLCWDVFLKDVCKELGFISPNA